MKICLATPDIQTDSIVDGLGIRSVIWTQGCKHHCPGCQNPETHAFDSGYEVDVKRVKMALKGLTGQDGITFSGGDPLEQVDACLEIAKYARTLGLNIWCYTGYRYEELLKMAKDKVNILEFLKTIDVLVDGRFILAEKSFNVPFRGSKNQRLIDVKKSLQQNEVVLIEIDDKIDHARVNNRRVFV